MSTAHASSVRGRRESLLVGDPLRAVAALGVLVYHSAYFVHSARFYRAYGQFAGHVLGSFHLGLFVFFALSGYLISAPFVHAFLAGEQLPLLGRYARRRVLRIVPAFWTILTLLLLAGGFFGAPAGQVVLTYAFAQNLGHGPMTHVMDQAWTLDVEVAFYLIVPAAAGVLAYTCRTADRRRRQRVLVTTLLAVAVGSLAARAFGPQQFAWQTSLPAMLFAFIPGIALATAGTTRIPARLRSRDTRWPAAVLLVAGSGLLVLYGAGIGTSRPPIVPTQSLDVFGFFLAASGAGAVLAGTCVFQWATGGCSRILNNRAMRWIGTRSYSLYLVHRFTAIAVIAAASGLTLSATARLALLLPVIVAVSLVMAAVSYRWFEVPFIHKRAARTTSLWPRVGKRPARLGAGE